MRRFLPLLLSVMLALAPALSWARPNFSAGSRGSHTYNAVPGTSTSPNGASPFQRSMTPNYGNSSYGNSYGQGYGGNYGGFRMRSPFTSGLIGGLIGAGLGGMLFGHGFFGGIHGGGGLLGFIIQMALLYFLARWLFRRFAGAPAMAGGPGFLSRGFTGFQNMMPGLGGGGRSSRPVAIVQSDYQAFEALLKNVQAAWSAHDLAALQRFATPEMVGYFGEQMAEQASRGVRNQVSDVRLQQGDLAEGLVGRLARVCDRGTPLLDGGCHLRSAETGGGRQPDREGDGNGGVDLCANARRQLGAVGDPADALTALPPLKPPRC